jgi:hypothetical protein
VVFFHGVDLLDRRLALKETKFVRFPASLLQRQHGLLGFAQIIDDRREIMVGVPRLCQHIIVEHARRGPAARLLR